MSRDAAYYKANLVVLELSKREDQPQRKDHYASSLTLDIWRDASSSSLRDIEKLFVCCPIWQVSPSGGAYMSRVIARIAPQLSIRDSVASLDA